MRYTALCRHNSVPIDLDITLNLAGMHNVLNSLAAIAVALEVGVDNAAIVAALAEFQGVGRRFQRYGELALPHGGSFTLIDDYGHHPVEMAATLAAVRGAFPDKRLVLAFQPHRYTRTRDLYDDFAEVLAKVDVLIMLDVYAAGEDPIPGADGRSLCRSIRQRGTLDPIFVATPAEVPGVLADVLKDGDVVLTQGAGNVGQLSRKLAELKLSINAMKTAI